MTSQQRPTKATLTASPWIIVGSALILMIIVVVLAVQNNNRAKDYMSRILKEKGAALIKGVEAGARTGMMGMMWGGQQVQTLLEETVNLPDVLYLTIINQDGAVLASSDKRLIGSHLDTPPTTDDGSDGYAWRIIETDGGQRSFEVHGRFSPVSQRDRRMNNRMHQMMRRRKMTTGSGNGWCLPSDNDGDQLSIFVGLNPEPFEEARQEDILNTIIISGVLLILGMAGFVSLFWMQSYRSTKRSLQDTSAIADEVVTSLPVGLIATDSKGMIAFTNNAAEKITGLDLSQARGKDPETLLPSHFCGLKEALERGDVISEKEMECEFTEDHVVPVSVSASRIINEAGQFVGQVLILRDLGEVRRLQDEIRRQEKLAAIGGLAAGVAHEIRNPLSSIKGIASYFKGKFDPQSHDQEMAGVMIEEVDRLNRVIGELLEFARPTELSLTLADINDLLKNSVRLIRKEAFAKDIEIDLTLSEDVLAARIDSDRLSQCLLNLYLNALQSMDKGGQLSIRSAKSKDGRINIKVQDTGTGIDPEDLNRVFDPYYTTKPKGTGLGLAIVHKIVEGHDGEIKVRSILGQGSTFTITLPVRTTT
jgi:two-component system sensor histidine kinase HydH